MVDVVVVGDGTHARMLGRLFLDCIKTHHKISYSESIKCVGASRVIIGIGNRATSKDSDLRRRKAAFDFNSFSCIQVKSNNAILLGRISNGTQLMPMSVVNYGARVGDNTIINTAAVVEHDCVVGPHCHVAPNATLCGGVRVGELTHIGAGAVVLQGITIGSNCVVGAGSVVTKDMPDNTTWIGTKFHDRV
jgi:sugar O-acyltransferase (sialic acid O-acetyltransferase NeuD family)